MSILESLKNAKFAAVLGLFALAGCDDVSNVMPGFYQGDVVGSTVTYANSKGPILVEIHGDPFGMRDSVLAEKVIAAMNGHLMSPILRFTTDQDEAGVPTAVFQIAFGWPQNENARKLCDKEIPDISPNLERITVAGAFCFNGERLVDAEGWVTKIQTPDDLQFKNLIADLARHTLNRKID